jgi:thioester reductase-like protein
VKTLEAVNLPAAVPVEDTFPVSFAQERIWFLEQLEPDSAAFTITAALEVAGELDVKALAAAIEDLGHRHEILRTHFVLDGDAPAQVVSAHPAMPLQVIDLDGLEPSAAVAAADAIVAAVSTASFDLRHAPLMRARLIRLARGRELLLLCLHHIVCDGWSADILIRDLTELYRARHQDTRPALAELPLQYADFAVWQRETLAGHELDRQLDFWRRNLDGVPRVLHLPTDRPRPAEQDFGGALASRTLPAALARDLVNMARGERASPFMLLLAAYQLVLARRSGQARFLVGTPVSGRSRPEISDVLGCFINLLVLRAEISGDPSLRELVSRVRRTCLDAYANQDLPFERLVEDLSPERDLARAPLAQVMLAVQDGLSGPVDVDGVVLTPRPVSSGVASYDLTLDAELAAEGFRLRLQYATALFDAGTAEAILDDLVGVLATMAADPGRPVSQVPFSAAPAYRAAQAWTGADRPAADDALVSVSRALSADRARPAVVGSAESWTGPQILAMVSTLADRLKQAGLSGEQTVAVCVEHGPRQLASILGVWAAQRSCLVIDGSAPQTWLRRRVETAPVAALLTDRRDIEGLPETLRVIEYPARPDPHDARVAQDDWLLPGRHAHPAAIAQLVPGRTLSGSSGFLALPQLAYTAAIGGLIEALQLTSDDTLATVTDLADGVCAAEPLAALAAGARVVIGPAGGVRDATELARLLADTHTTVMRASAGMWQALNDAGWRPGPGFRAVCAQTLPAGLAADMVAAGARVIEIAGPADRTGWLTSRELSHSAVATPLPGVRLAVVDFCGAPALPGAVGRLWIGGSQEPRGYAGRPAATAQDFRPAPEGRRFRCTPDLVRRSSDGEMSTAGRSDGLLAAHERLIDPAELENALAACEGVTTAAVVLTGAGELVAFHAPGSADPQVISACLNRLLPAYLRPDRLVPVDLLPTTATGQVDRAALSAARARPGGSGPAVRPRTYLERALLDCFGTALGRRDIGVLDDFFESGGTSLTAARLVAALPAAAGCPVPLKLLFQASSVASLAAALESPDGPAGREQAVDLALRDARLPDDIAPDPALPRRVDGLGRVLLTGVTGFLGPHLAAELLAAGAQEVICLVRGEDPAGRVEANLRRFELDVDRARVTVLPGDLTLPMFGLSTERFAALADRIDAIYHCGAVMNFVLPYRALRAPNPHGTRQILQLACQGRPSPVHYISTIDMRVGDHLPEAIGPIDHGSLDGYVLSKKTGEHLVLEAGRRGLPVGVYRPWLITGATTTGAVGVRDQLALCLAGSLIAGVMPADTPLPLHVLPVDMVSRAIVRLSLEAPRANPIHQFYNPQIAPMDSIRAYLDSTGYPLRAAPFEEWRVLVARRTAGRLDGLAALLTIDAPANGDPDVVETGNMLSGLGGDIGFPAIDVEYVHKTVAFLVREGLAPPLPAHRAGAAR